MLPQPLQEDGEERSLTERVREFERRIIAEALAEADGRVTGAARALNLSHQALCYIINHRHQSLLAVRTPIRIRPQVNNP